ncbi:MAG: hypothetical protein IAF58_02020 [Leptolyngbya sp.]|nr:hypothetical protein [Candidatus Melainabacteria bacterium]
MFSSLKSALTIALSVLCICPSQHAYSASTIPVEVFEIENKIFGNRTLFVSKDTVKVMITRDQVVIQSKAPYSEVVIFNNRSRMIHRNNAAKSISDIRAIGEMLSDFNGIQIIWRPHGKQVLQGVPCNVYLAEIIHEKNRNNQADTGDWRKYWTRIDVGNTSKAQGEIISAACGSPAIPGIPQRLEYFGAETDFNVSFLARSNIDSKKKILRVLQSTKSYKHVDLPANTFAIPTDYKFKKDITKVLLPGNSRSSLKDMKMSPDFLFETK